MKRTDGSRQTASALNVQTTSTASIWTASTKLFSLADTTIPDINRAFKAKALTSEQLVQLYLNRINAYDQQGPTINSLISVNPNALKIARARDLNRPEHPASPLYGIPIILKDNFDTVDLPTTSGSDVLVGALPPDDAFTVKRFREAGAIILGKANMSEFSLSSGRLGYSSLGGLTRNPHDLTRDASGSSSGSAAAIAANFATLATGTDSAGSIRGPASFTGLVGIKPTLGLTSRDGIAPLALTVDVCGPIAKTVTDAAIGLSAMAGVDSNDCAMLESERTSFDDYTQFLDADAFQGAKIAIARDFVGDHPEVDQIVGQALATMFNLGATIVEVNLSTGILDATTYGPLLHLIVQAEFFPQIEAYLQTLPNRYPKTLQELIEASLNPALVNSETPVNPHRIEVYQDALEQGGVSNPNYLAALAQLPNLRKHIVSMFAADNLDAIIYPTVGSLPTLLTDANNNKVEDPTFFCESGAVEINPYRASYLANLTGFPDITVPAGFTRSGLPVGLSFFATAYSEPRLVGLAYAFEQAIKLSRSPSSTPPLPGELFRFET